MPRGLWVAWTSHSALDLWHMAWCLAGSGFFNFFQIKLTVVSTVSRTAATSIFLYRGEKDKGMRESKGELQADPDQATGSIPRLRDRNEATWCLRRQSPPPPRHLSSAAELQELNSLPLTGNWTERNGSETCCIGLAKRVHLIFSVK